MGPEGSFAAATLNPRVPRSRDGRAARLRDNRLAMTTVEEPLSPELVLVAPPDLAAAARRLLPDTPFVLPVSGAAEASIRYGLGFVAFVAVCVVATLGPFALALIAQTR
jgi:hypothetical protein